MFQLEKYYELQIFDNEGNEVGNIQSLYAFTDEFIEKMMKEFNGSNAKLSTGYILTKESA